MSITTRDALEELVNSGAQVKYIFFWGHQNKQPEVTKSCLSQWYCAPFENDNIQYMSAEHFMMAEKARLFDDMDIYSQIVNAKNPGEAKALGRKVANFDEQVWCANRFDIVVKANLLKFSQNEALKAFLLGTKERVLVEASPVDRIWGVGLSADDEQIQQPGLWKGLNLLGFALMQVRDILRNEEG